MATTECSVARPRTPSRLQSTISDSPVLSVDQCIEKATEKLLFKDFEECIRICEAGITEAHIHSDSDSVKEKIETLCILTVQAHAELNRWQLVVPFVQQVFGSMENCPYKVLQLCILLHSKVKEYAQCHALSSIWLKHPLNFTNPGYVDIVEMCIRHILLPQDKMALIPDYLNACPGVNQSDKQNLANFYSTSGTANHVHEGSGSKSRGHYDTDVMEMLKDPDKTNTTKITKYHTDNRLINVAKSIVSSMKLYRLDVIVKIAALSVCLYLLAFQGYDGDTSSNFGRLTTLGRNLLRAVKSLLWPGSLSH